MPEISTRHAFTIRLTVAPTQLLGAGPNGDRRVVPVTGGAFEGARLRGTVLAGGSDWILLRHDGAMELNVRLVLQADDGALIGMTYRGLRHGPDAVMARLAAGELVDPSEYYFRSSPVFETAAPGHAWLTRAVFVATGERPPEGPTYHVFEVL